MRATNPRFHATSGLRVGPTPVFFYRIYVIIVKLNTERSSLPPRTFLLNMATIPIFGVKEFKHFLRGRSSCSVLVFRFHWNIGRFRTLFWRRYYRWGKFYVFVSVKKWIILVAAAVMCRMRACFVDVHLIQVWLAGDFFRHGLKRTVRWDNIRLQ